MKKYTFRFKAWSGLFYKGVLEYVVYAINEKDAKDQFDKMAFYNEYRIELI